MELIMGKIGDGREFADHLKDIPNDKRFALQCQMSAGAMLPKEHLADPTDPNIVGEHLPVLMVTGELSRAAPGFPDEECVLGQVCISITLADAKILKRSITRLEQAIDPSKEHERN
jgi:hypothetical protein